MALYDIIIHQNKDETGTAYSEVYPNLASGDPNIYNVLVAGEDGVPRLPNMTIQERLDAGLYSFYVVEDNVTLDGAGGLLALKEEYVELVAQTETQALFIRTRYGATPTVGSQIRLYRNTIWCQTFDGATDDAITFDAASGDYYIYNVPDLSGDSYTLYLDSVNYQLVKRAPEAAIANYVRGEWQDYGGVADDPDARAKIDALIAVVNGILKALRAHKVIEG